MRADEIMEQIEELLAGSMVIPVKKNSVIVDAAKLRDYIEQLRDCLPGELEEAQNIIRQRDYILSSAKSEAQTIIRNAEENRKQLVSNSEIIRAAENRAKTIMFNANAKAAELNRASMEYIENNLKEAEESLAKSLQSIHATRQSFSAKKQK